MTLYVMFLYSKTVLDHGDIAILATPSTSSASRASISIALCSLPERKEKQLYSLRGFLSGRNLNFIGQNDSPIQIRLKRRW